MITADTLDELLALPAEERLIVAEALWNSLARDPSKVPVPDWHREILEQRIADDDADPSEGETWDALRRRLETGR